MADEAYELTSAFESVAGAAGRSGFYLYNGFVHPAADGEAPGDHKVL